MLIIERIWSYPIEIKQSKNESESKSQIFDTLFDHWGRLYANVFARERVLQVPENGMVYTFPSVIADGKARKNGLEVAISGNF